MRIEAPTLHSITQGDASLRKRKQKCLLYKVSVFIFLKMHVQQRRHTTREQRLNPANNNQNILEASLSPSAPPSIGVKSQENCNKTQSQPYSDDLRTHVYFDEMQQIRCACSLCTNLNNQRNVCNATESRYTEPFSHPIRMRPHVAVAVADLNVSPFRWVLTVDRNSRIEHCNHRPFDIKTGRLFGLVTTTPRHLPSHFEEDCRPCSKTLAGSVGDTYHALLVVLALLQLRIGRVRVGRVGVGSNIRIGSADVRVTTTTTTTAFTSSVRGANLERRVVVGGPRLRRPLTRR